MFKLFVLLLFPVGKQNRVVEPDCGVRQMNIQIWQQTIPREQLLDHVVKVLKHEKCPVN